MTYPATGDGTTQHGGDVILDQQVAEVLGTVPAGESNHGGNKVPQAPRSDTGHRLALLPARS